MKPKDCAIFRILPARGIFVFAMLLVVLSGFIYAESAEKTKPPAPVPAPETKLTLEQIKAALIQKNIFKPARVPPPLYPMSDPTYLPLPEIRPRPLKRPFRVVGILTIDDKTQAVLRFEDPVENKIVYAGDALETIEIKAIEPTYLLCDYAGWEVRISVMENSNDALALLLGLDSSTNYHLIGTTVSENDSSAMIYFPGESRYRKVRINDMVGVARVIDILPGKVRLLDQDGDEITIEAGIKLKR